MSDVEERVKELEIRYTHQTAVIDTLSELVREQQSAIDALRKALNQLRESMPGEEPPPHEAPPHY